MEFSPEDCAVILEDTLGPLASRTASVLLSSDGITKKDLLNALGESLNVDKKLASLVILIQHGLVHMSLNARSQLQYSIRSRHVVLRLLIPRFLCAAKALFGEAGQLITRYIFEHGSATADDIIGSIVSMESGDGRAVSTPTAIQLFTRMVEQHFISRLDLPEVVSRDGVKNLVGLNGDELFVIPNHVLSALRNKKALSGGQVPAPKRLRLEQGTFSMGEEVEEEIKGLDGSLFWRINMDRFTVQLIEEVVSGVAAEVIDQNAAIIVRAVMSQESRNRPPVAKKSALASLTEVMARLPPVPVLEESEVISYLNLLRDDLVFGYLEKVDSAQSVNYQINIYDALQHLCEQTVASVVQERFGPKAGRMYRYLFRKKYADLRNICLETLVEEKEALSTVYELGNAGFVEISDLQKAFSHNQYGRSYLFSVDLPAVAKLVLRKSVQIACKLVSSRRAQVEKHRSVLDKNELVENRLQQLRLQEISEADMEAAAKEIAEFISPTERQELRMHRMSMLKLDAAESKVANSVIILYAYLAVHFQDTLSTSLLASKSHRRGFHG